MQIVLPHGFSPRRYQREAMAARDNGSKRNVWVWHRRAGKDLTALHQDCKDAHRRVGAYWHIFPTAEQGRKAIWEGFTRDGLRIMEQVFPAAIRQSPRNFTTNGEMVVVLKCGSIWRLLGSDKMEVVGAGPVGVTFSEFSLAKPNTWDLIRPMLRENDGSATFIFTPRGKNHGWKLLEMARSNPDWFTSVRTLRDTMAYDPEATVREERASGMDESMIQQEYFCDFTAANVGSYYGVALSLLESQGRLCRFDTGTDGVYTSWDLGRSDSTAIWWWRVGPRGVEVLAHYSCHGEDLEHYFAKVDDMAQRHGWRYARHFLPHDARAKTLSTKASVLEQAARHFGVGMVGITPEIGLLDGIQALRRLLTSEGTLIHPRCSEVEDNRGCDGVEALRAYHREWDDERKCFRETPVHDWSSHSADGARYMAVMVETAMGRVVTQQRKTPVVPQPLTNGIRLGLEDAIPAHSGGQGRIG